MDEIVSLVVANGVFAVLFCGLLVYELKDSRRREQRYTQTIKTLTERMETVNAIKSDTAEIKAGIKELAFSVKSGRVKEGCDKKSKRTGGETKSVTVNQCVKSTA